MRLMRYDSDTEESGVQALREQLRAFERPQVKQCRRSLREAYRQRSHSEFCAAFSALGMSAADLARHLGVSRQYVHDLLNGRREIQDWILRAMPREARMVIARGYVDGLEQSPISEAG